MKRERSILARALRSEKLRFGLVGGINTTVDFVILFLLVRIIGVPVLFANMISTSCAVIVSYILNKNAVFKNSDKQSISTFMLFVAITLTGLWGVQSVVILAVDSVLSQTINKDVTLLIAKVIATSASFVWNYLWYSRVIFRNKNEK